MLAAHTPTAFIRMAAVCFREKVPRHAILSFRRLRALITPQPVGKVGLNFKNFLKGAALKRAGKCVVRWLITMIPTR